MEARIVLEKKLPEDLTLLELLTSPMKFDKLNFNDSLENVAPDNFIKTISEIKTKLNSGGKISIQGFDLYELSYAIVNDRLSTFEYNKIIQDRKQILCIPDIIFILNKVGLRIISKDIDSMKFLVEAIND